MSTELFSSRPNIRIQIQNSLAELEAVTPIEAMDVDEEPEEGEICDLLDTESLPLMNLDKLRERANRFNLKPNEVYHFTEKHLQVVYSSLGMNTTSQHLTRLQAIHLRSTIPITVENVFEYFLKYAPNSIEFIDDESCNVVWNDNISATRALHFISKPIRGMPIRSMDGRLNKAICNLAASDWECVDVSEVHMPIPPGYWRLGVPHCKLECTLMRFALKTDKQPYKTVLLSKYYGRPILKSDNKEQIQHDSRTLRQATNTEPTRGSAILDKYANPDSNPWVVLAENWDEDKDFRERERKVIGPMPRNIGIVHRLGDPDETGATTREPSPPRRSAVRMRMYADDEEELIKRRTLLKKVEKMTRIASGIESLPNNRPAIPKMEVMKRFEVTVQQSNSDRGSDLRDVLKQRSQLRKDRCPSSNTVPMEDLGTTLKNRKRKMQQVKSHIEVREKRRKPSSRSEEKRKSRSSHHRMHFRTEMDKYDQLGRPLASKVAVVIKRQKKPVVASSVLHRPEAEKVKEVSKAVRIASVRKMAADVISANSQVMRSLKSHQRSVVRNRSLSSDSSSASSTSSTDGGDASSTETSSSKSSSSSSEDESSSSDATSSSSSVESSRIMRLRHTNPVNAQVSPRVNGSRARVSVLKRLRISSR